MSTRVALHAGQLLQAVPGGIGRYIRELVHALPAHEVAPSTFAAGPLTGLGVPHVDLGWPRGSLRYELWHRFRRPRLRLETDVVHAPSVAIPPTDRPLVVTVHDVAPLRHPEWFTAQGVRFHTRGLELARARAQAIIAPSTFTRDELVAVGFDATSITIVPNGATPLPLTDTPPSIELPEHFVLAVGTIEPRKGIEIVRDAVRQARRQVPDLALVVAGPRGWGDPIALDEPWILELGVVADELLAHLYARADAVAVASRYEGFGLPALEAMTNGAPVVASDATSLPEVVGAAGRLVAVGDIDAWADAFAALASDADQREALRAAGRARAAGFTWEATAARHAEVYRRSARLPR